MNWTRFWNRLTGRPAREEASFDEEVAFHAEMKARELTAAGLNEETARGEARRALGNVTLAREQVREAWSFPWLADAWQDVRYGARGLAAQPGFAAAAVLALVLGIGVNAIVFNVYNALALAPYAVRDAHLVVEVWGERGASWSGFTWPEYRYFREHSKNLAGVVGTTNTAARIARNAGETGWDGPAAAVSDNFFKVIGTGFAHGRGFSPEAGRVRDPAAEIVLHYDTWVARFGSDSGILGQWLHVNGHKLQVVGIAAAGFSGPQPTNPAVWIPAPWRDIFEPGQTYYDTVNSCCTSVIGRLGPGVTRARVTAELTGLIAQFRKSVGKEPGRVRVTTPTLLASPKAEAGAGPVFAALGVTALLILLLACANVANLQIARAIARNREISVRLALGAGRGRLLRQMLAESLLVASIAGAIGAVLAAWAPSRIVDSLVDEPGGIAIRFNNDYRVLGFITTVTLLAALVSGLAPAWGAVRKAAAEGLREGRAVISGSRLRRGLLVVQVALSAVLVSGAMLMVRVADHARRIDPGLSPSHVIHMQLGLGSSGATDEQSRVLVAALGERIAALPGIESVAQSLAVPLGNTNMGMGGIKDPNGATFKMGFDRVSPDFHGTLRIPLRAGAGFGPRDGDREGEVAVLNQAAAERLFPGENPLGKPIQPGSKTIVAGVTGKVTTRQFGSENDPYMWVAAPASRGTRLLIRHAPGAGEALLAVLPALARQQDKRFVATAAPYSQTVAAALRGVGVAAAIAAVLGALALLLACVGIYGVAAYGVSRHTREIGLRMALGARPAGIFAMVLRQNLRTVGVGVAAGVAGSIGFGQLLKGMLYGLSPTDPVALASALAILTATAVLAVLAPARRASAVDPAITLRED